MNMYPIGRGDEMSTGAGDQRTAALRQMTVAQLLHLGTRQVVYLKTSMCVGEQSFVLHDAGGTPLVMVDTQRWRWLLSKGMNSLRSTERKGLPFPRSPA
jgi:hypothetical protein